MTATTVTKTWYDPEGDEQEIVFPAKYEVCSCCDGKGTHVNRAIDGNGLSRDDFAEDPDFEEAYFSGAYDVTCEECGGERVVAVIDDAALTEKQRGILQDIDAAERESAAADRSERYLRDMGM